MNIPQPSSPGWTREYLRQLDAIVDGILPNPRERIGIFRQLEIEAEQEAVENTVHRCWRHRQAVQKRMFQDRTPETWVAHLIASRLYFWALVVAVEDVIAARGN